MTRMETQVKEQVNVPLRMETPWREVEAEEMLPAPRVLPRPWRRPLASLAGPCPGSSSGPRGRRDYGP